ncbi:hypothetical protein P7C71_g4177, partial [Lecanoromycetidae sp. Uapishka_2]
MMTTAIRQEFNEMSLGLNAAIKAAVAQNAQNGVTYIDIDSALTGHRFCEEGINEPDQHNPNLWLWHYPYNEPSDTAEISSTGAATSGPDYTSVINAANAKVFGTASITQLSQEYANARAVDDAWYNALDYNAIQQLSGGVDAQGPWDGIIGARAKLFHPQVPFHEWIQQRIVYQYTQDRDIDSTQATSTQAGAPGPTAPASQPARWSYKFHTYTGNLATGAFSFFVLPGLYNGDFTKVKRSLGEPGESTDTLPSRFDKRELDARLLCDRDSVDKRQCGPIFPTPPTITNGQVSPTSLLPSPKP